MRQARVCVRLLLALLLLAGLERFCYMQTGGFRMAKALSDLPYRPEWDAAVWDPPRELLEQRYTFLGKGVQCYAFESEDKKTVLKLFKHYHSFPSNTFLEALPALFEPLRRPTLRARYRRIDAIYRSCKIAMEELKEETGMLYLHLNPTSHLKRTLTLVDKLGIAHPIDLDTTPFLLQKKGELLFERLSALMQRGERERAKHAIRSLLERIQTRSQKGIANTDPIMRRNFGFLGEEAFEIDTGSFSKDPFLALPYRVKQEVIFETAELSEWLAAHYPELIPFMESEIDALLAR